MHSIVESDGVSSDPYEILCHMGTLIIEGRTPITVKDTPNETGVKSAKPYNEGPHCPNFMKLYNKDTHNNHKCTENNILCIRYNNLKQNLLSLRQKSPSVFVEVSLGPDCLCGELRSQSTLVLNQPSKRDIVLEQWTITIGHKQMQESSSQMSIVNLFQAVRSLLHFSQLTAWYMCNHGMKPANVIYRIGILEDATFISDDNFINHDFPVADINKSMSMKISVKTLPRMEKIPAVFCLQHPAVTVDTSLSPQFEKKELQKDKGFFSPDPLHFKFSSGSEGELLENKLPLKFQGVRKKTYEAQERKRKKHITLYSPTALEMDSCSGVEFFDGMPIDEKKLSFEKDTEYFGNKRIFQGESLKPYYGESSKTEYKKSKPSTFSTDFSELVKSQSDFESFEKFSCNFFEQKVLDPSLDLFKSFSDSKSKSDFRTKSKINSCDLLESTSENVTKKLETKSAIDILDDRMQISCAISGKHHCKWECEDESDLNNSGENLEKPKRRRSLSKVRLNESCEDIKLSGLDSEKILHGKFKEIDSCQSSLCSPFRECEKEKPKQNESASLKTLTNSPDCLTSSKSLYLESKTNINLDNYNSLTDSKPQTLIIESLPLNKKFEDSLFSKELSKTAFKSEEERSSRKEASPEIKENLGVRTESFESFRKGCTFAMDSTTDFSSDSEAEFSDDHLETSNPFLAAILRTTKRSKMPKDLKTSKKCDNNVKNEITNDGKEKEQRKKIYFLENLKDIKKSYINKEMNNFKTKTDNPEKLKNSVYKEKIFCESCKSSEENSDLRMSRKKTFAIKNYKNFSEFQSKNLGLLKSVLDIQDLKQEERTSDGYDEFDEIGSNNLSSTKTIPVPSAHDKLKFRRSLDSAAQLVFHRCSGLPLTSSPAPVRRNTNSFCFDSSLNSVSAIKSALFEPSNSLSSEDENESEGSLKSPASPGAWSVGSKQINYHSLSPLPLLGSFEESVLNGRLEPVSTVQGFTAELGASGFFCPRHLYLPVTVFFYTLGDNDKVSAPYLGHINLGKKGYNVPRSGTIQVTLFNPMRTVVKMFVVVYDLHDMPVNSHTFLRQRTLYVPASQKESTYTDKKEIPFDQENYHKYLRYLIHLRFVSGKTGKIYLHTDIRMVIFKKADEDTATALGNQCDGETYELRSHTHGPINPKFSPRK